MVKTGQYSVQLVHAETKQPFPEHMGPNRRTVYVEAEPNAEYFVRIQTEGDDTVLVRIAIDGKDLGYSSYISRADRAVDHGLWNRVHGKSTETALKFKKAKVQATIAEGARPTSWTGKVEVKIFEAASNGFEALGTVSSNWNEGNDSDVTGTAGVDDDEKTGIKTVVGSHSEESQMEPHGMIYKKGKELTHIKMHYCTVVDLIDARVLPKPPMWDYHRLVRPRNLEEEPNVQPREPTIATVVQTIGNVEQDVQVEMFDLLDYESE